MGGGGHWHSRLHQGLQGPGEARPIPLAPSSIGSRIVELYTNAAACEAPELDAAQGRHAHVLVNKPSWFVTNKGHFK